MNRLRLFVVLIFAVINALNAQVGIGTSTPHASAILELKSTVKGLLPPRLTTTERNAISTPSNGLLIYNTNESRLNVYSSNAWQAIPHSTTGAAGITLGTESGFTGQNYTALAIGQGAGYSNQASGAISIGNYAGSDAQNIRAIAIGYTAGYISQGASSIAIGHAAGVDGQGNNSVAIGYQAGNSLQGAYSIAIGYKAATAYQPSNSIVLNASSTQLDVSTSGFFVNPIRSAAGGSGIPLYYDATTKEIYYTMSDARLKNNVLPMQAGLDEVMKLRTVSYDYKRNLEDSEYPGHATGFIAQEVQEVLPELISVVPGKDSLLAINASGMIPVLVKAIQELKAENKILSAKLERIELKTRRSGRIFGRKRD